MSLTIQEVEHIAELARLTLTDEEKEMYRQQLSAVLDYFKDLQQVDTHQISPTFRFTNHNVHSRLRSDEVKPSLTWEALQRNAPQEENHQYRVPPVLDYEG